MEQRADRSMELQSGELESTRGPHSGTPPYMAQAHFRPSHFEEILGVAGKQYRLGILCRLSGWMKPPRLSPKSPVRELYMNG